MHHHLKTRLIIFNLIGGIHILDLYIVEFNLERQCKDKLNKEQLICNTLVKDNICVEKHVVLQDYFGLKLQ